MKGRLWLSLIGSAVLVTVGYTLSAESQQLPPFRAAADLIEVDAIVTDETGSFVFGLRPEDFELYEDGRPREIASFSSIHIPIGAQPLQRSLVVAPDIARNQAPGRVFVLLLDDLGPASRPLIQQAARRFVDESLGETDLVAVIHPQGSMTAVQSFTSNRSLILRAIDNAGSGPALNIGYCDPIRIRNSYRAIEDVSTRLGNIDGRRKAVLWMTHGVPFDAAEECGLSAAQAGALSFAQRDAIRTATRHNVAIYPIDFAGLTPGLGRPEQMRQAGMRLIAEETGAEAIVNTNNFTDGYNRIVRDNSSYYLLGYYPETEWRDGRFHSIAVRVRRSGVVVRARRGYYAPDPVANDRARAAVADGLSPEAARALRSPLPTAGLTMTVFATPFKGSGRTNSVLLGARLNGADLRPDAADRIEISWLTIDADGNVRPGTAKIFTLNSRDQNREAIGNGNSALSYFDRIELAPGRYELRLIAHQPGGPTGGVVTHVDVPDFTRGGLSMSGIVLGSANVETGWTLLHDELLRAVLGSDPVVRRQFAATDTLTAFVELYTDTNASPWTRASWPQSQRPATGACTKRPRRVSEPMFAAPGTRSASRSPDSQQESTC